MLGNNMIKYGIMILVFVSIGCAKQGVVGPKGDTGPQGSIGESADSCSVTSYAAGTVFAPNGGTLITCPNGTSSIVLNGTNGNDGAAGIPGTVITPVQFCSGFVQSYPNTFAESGLCINNQMWGVYSANGAFLAALPPGVYSSDGINSSCTFTITENCGVSQ